jgi:hypothetical protein
MIDPVLLKEAIEDAKYLQLWFGPFKQVWKFEWKDGAHRLQDGTTADDFVSQYKGKGKLSMVYTLCETKTCSGAPHGQSVGIKFFEDYKKWYEKFAIAEL